MKENMVKVFKNYFFIGLGAFIMGFGLHFFLFPNKIASGGVTGLALIINYVFGISSSLVVTILNFILFTLAFILISGEFGLKSIYAAFLLSISLSIFEKVFPGYTVTRDLILVTIFGSVFLALGATIIFLYDASTGGTSIIGKILNKYFHISIGTALFIADAAVTVMAVFAFGVELALFGLLSVYLTSYMIDRFIDGFNSRKQIMIVTKHKDIIIDYILKDFDRGCTVFKGKGAYSGEEKDVLLTILERRQFVNLRKFLKLKDPEAFVTVTDTTKVFGEGFDQLH